VSGHVGDPGGPFDPGEMAFDPDEIGDLFDPGDLGHPMEGRTGPRATPEERVDGAFAELSRVWPAFEPRPQQREMAVRVLDALDHGGRIAVEAPTGVGKSIAYLIPAILVARDQGLKVVISTQTKNLQQQVVARDAPRVRDVLAPDLRMSILKGRQNYLCTRRHQRHAQRELLPGVRDDFLRRLDDWVAVTRTGDLEEFGARDGEEWGWLRELAAPQDLEEGVLCQRVNQCFLRESRRRAAQSGLVVVNHALLLTHHLTPAQILPEYDVLIVDEAHTLPQVATRTLERRASPARLRAMLARLGGGADLRLLERARLLLESSANLPPDILAGSGGAIRPDEATAATGRVADALRTVRGVGDAFFRDVSRSLGEEERRFGRREAEEGVLGPTLDAFVTGLSDLMAASMQLAGLLARVPVTRESDEETVVQVTGATTEVAEFLDTLRFTVETPDESYVYWYEGRPEPALVAVPLEPGERLFEELFSRVSRCVLTSATLATGRRFDHFIREVGLSPDVVETAQVGSPFDLERQVRALAPRVPGPSEPGFEASTVDVTAALARAVPRKMLVLFTSHGHLRAVRSGLDRALRGEDVTLLAQGVDGSRERVTRDFRRARRAVLLGTASFWEGVDFPGEELEVLVVARLPFPVPTNPIVEARCERLEASGVSPFGAFMLPEAVLRFRQGFGRLIRRRTDRGLFVILDPRIITARYRGRFSAALPVPVEVLDGASEVADAARAWFPDPETAPDGRT